jgi:predicted aspartyl protease
MKYKGYVVAKMLIDNGFTLNVLPKHMMDQISMMEHQSLSLIALTLK